MATLGAVVVPEAQAAFRDDQLRFPRVREARQSREAIIQGRFTDAGLTWPPTEIFLRVFKHEQVLELWGRDKVGTPFTLVHTWSICESSGTLGPKRKRGDLQVPEGFYRLNHFNPYSTFYLSLKVNYPNASDRKLGVKGSLGGDIFIHGDCVTIGCVPITDDGIRELYWAAVEAKSTGQSTIPVHIFPFHMNKKNMDDVAKQLDADSTLLEFWQTLVEGYEAFESSRLVPAIRVDTKGRYRLKKPAPRSASQSHSRGTRLSPGQGQSSE
jgi:murein L,D-transpeptidase YafK